MMLDLQRSVHDEQAPRGDLEPETTRP
jgi:hypothetical protein